MVYQFALSFFLPLVLSLLVTPFVIWLAPHIGAVDLPDPRKVHSRPMPRLGGMAIFVSVIFSFMIFFLLGPEMPYFAAGSVSKISVFIGALCLVFLLGIWDDIKTLNPGQKFLVQFVIASLIYLAGFRISSVTNLLGDGTFDIGWLDYPVTIFWIVGVTNAVNLIDGLDGLASGVSLIAVATIGAISFIREDFVTATMVLVFAGAITGFLRYNFNPARIFLGDSGSLFIGFALATLAMQSSTKGSTIFAILVPILALGLPIMDTILAMTRRFLASLLPDQQEKAGSLAGKLHGMFLPDRKHIHHQLLSMGLRHRHAVLVLYLVSCLFGIGALSFTFFNDVNSGVLLVIVACIAVIGIRQLRYKEMAILRNGILLPLYEWPVINRRLLKGILDLCYSAGAFTAAHFLAYRDETLLLQASFLYNLAITCSAQMLVLYFAGLYNASYRYLGIGDILVIARNVAAAVALPAVIIMTQPNPYPFAVFILDFYFLLSAVAGTRMSFYVLTHLFRKDTRDREGRSVIIYGADNLGLLTLRHIMNDDSLDLSPIGFIDETPSLEGKRLEGLPVYGHWKLSRLLNKHKIDQILIPRETISPEVLRRLNEIADRYGIEIMRTKISLEQLPAEAASSQRADFGIPAA
jgi:UDP-GlcNAc:undecaprenyl-phosphate/decaprenyl-phosphate GlcNAc-1-phosphate transferase